MTLGDVLGPLDGGVFPGGCDCCDAEQEITTLAGGVYVITILHDADCPVLAHVNGSGS
jgi:hypothetical protein